MTSPGPALFHARVTAPGRTPEKWALFLHGIFGSGGNWRTFARRLVEQRPAWGAALVDLRMHGNSQGFSTPHTVAAAADDLAQVERALPGPVAAVVGHSFGAKVSLEYVARRGGELDVAWILDGNPGARPLARGSETTLAVLDLLAGMPPVLPSREDFTARVTAAGYSREIAAWLAMNLRPADQGGGARGYALRTDLAAIRALLDDYFARDLWPVLEAPRGRAKLHLVLGGRSPVFDDVDRARAHRAAAAAPERVVVHTLPDAGHWVHVDAPDELFALLAGSFV